MKVQTSINTTFQGTIYSYNPGSGLLTLALEENSKSVVLDKGRVESALGGSAKNYKIIKTSFIKNIQVLGKKAALKKSNSGTPLETITNLPEVGQIDELLILRKYEAAERLYRQDYELNKILHRQVVLKNHLGIEIFTKLYKILPVGQVKFANSNNDIEVFGSIVIKFPYLEVKYKDSRADDDGLDHIKKIVSEAKPKGG